MARQTPRMRKNTRIVPRVQAASLADLARHHAAVVPRQAFALLPAWLTKPAAPFSGLIARQCIEATNKLKAMQAWFEGAIAAVDDVPVIGFIDEDETLAAAMEDFEAKLLGMRADIQNVASSVQAMDCPRMWPTRDALQAYAQANADLFDSVRAFKWAVHEHDYGAGMMAGLATDSLAVFQSLVARLKR